MIKLTFCVKRRPDITKEEFDRYWYEHHAKLVKKNASALKIKRYVQVPVLDRPSAQESIRKSRGAMSLEFDGIAELWWESFEDLVAGGKSKEGRKASLELLEDEKKFIDLSKSMIWYGEEREIF